MNSDLRVALIDVLRGDIKKMALLRERAQEDLVRVADEMGALVLSRDALARVISGMIGKEYSDSDVQRWASFIRRGYFEGKSPYPVERISIGYDGNDDDMVDIISRFDELGDQIDGTVSISELQTMRDSLLKKVD